MTDSFNESFIPVDVDTYLKGFHAVGIYRSDKLVYRVYDMSITSWIESHPEYLWEKYEPNDEPQLWKHYTFSPEFEVWFKLKWS